MFPGETIRTEIWRDGDVVSFRALVPERNVVAMNNGRAEVQAMSERAATDLAPIREAVRALCADFPGEYWRKLDRERAYPTEFVAGADQGRLPRRADPRGIRRQRAARMSAAAAIMEEIHASGCNGAACHAQMYTMGTVLRHGSAAQKQQYLPGIAKGELRLQAFGVTEPTSGTDTLVAAHHGGARRQRRLRRQRPEDLDLARRAFRPDAAARAHHAARAGQEAHRRAVGVPGRHARR